MFKNLDDYTLQARVSPILIVCFPTLLWIASLFSGESTFLGLLTSLISFCGLGPLIGQLGRDSGLKRQEELLKQWGGKPTTLLFRFTNSKLDRHMLEEIHSNMKFLLPDTPNITNADERQDQSKTDSIYERWTNYLREATRDYHLVQQENINYGFRRNLFGLRVIGIGMAILPLLVIMLESLSAKPSEPLFSTAMTKVTVGISFFALWFHWQIVSANWVKTAADAYAKRLLFSSDRLVAAKKTQATVVRD